VEAGSLEPSLDLFVRSLKPGDTVYDIGSNVGVYTVLLAQVVGEKGTVVAFEPHLGTYEQLLENIRLNGLTNVRPFQKAVGERNSQEKLYIGEVIANFSLLAGAIEGPPDKYGIPFQLVEVVQGDPFVQALRLPAPRAVKIDVEGFEYSVICGLRQTLANPWCRMVCCEVHPQYLPPEVKGGDIHALLAALGYDRMEGQPSKTTYHLMAYKS
jgi:FkbM family methyltransferase